MMRLPTSPVEYLYARALRLYPLSFRLRHGEPMLRAVRDALEDRGSAPAGLVRTLIQDLLMSLIKEHCAMLHDTFGRPAIVYNALVLSGVATVLAAALYAIPQQVLRLGANDPQIAMAGDLAARLESGAVTAAAIPPQDIDMSRSLTPFLIVYDDAGTPLASQARLNGTVPAPPAGVFAYVRQHGEERISWQPVLGGSKGVRIAAVVQRVGGSHPGFILAGRSLREVEIRELQVKQMAAAAWVGMLGLILLGTAVFGWWTRAPAALQPTH